MMLKFKNSWRIIVTLLIIGGIIAIPFLAAAEQQVDYNEDYLAMKTVEEMYVTYNKRINDMINDAIKKTLTGEVVVKISKDDAEQNELCSDRENIAAICLGIRALYEHKGYEEAMTRAKSNPQINLFKDEIEAEKIGEAYNKLGAKTNFIDREIARSRDSQEMTIDFYTEFMGAEQMHKQNEKLLLSLAAYNEKLAGLRTETYSLPPKFHNVTTDGGGCT